MATVTSANKQNIFIPDGVWDNIFSYFHSSYKKPSHLIAFKQTFAIYTEENLKDRRRWANRHEWVARLAARIYKLYVPDLNIWYDVRTGYIHEHIRNIRYHRPLPYDQSHEEEIGDQELNKDFLHEELRDFIEESNNINVRLLPLIVECNRL